MKTILFSVLVFLTLASSADPRPNIVWMVGEDMGPELGCYGDAQAITPNMDRLAKEGARFTKCFTHAPVCAPSRSGLITGQYPTTIGTHHMRSKLIVPPATFTSLLRKAGYHVAWPGKTDFNFDVPASTFDSTADWTKELLPQPFFAYVNFPDSHESSIRMKEKFARITKNLSATERHDPKRMSVPPYHPETPEVRRDLANYYDLVTAVDKQMGRVLKFLEDQGVADNTVVILMGDHGRGLPRSKRWLYDSGIHVPLIVRWPGKIQPGTVRDDLVSFIDFAPTTLSLAGVTNVSKAGERPRVVGGQDDAAQLYAPMQGIVFLGPQRQQREYIFAARDRMDETFDRIRAVRTKQFKYIRNFYPELSRGQIVAYGEEMPTMQVWRRFDAEGKLNEVQRAFFEPTKPVEELYDCNADPHEIRNLAESSEHQMVLKELRSALETWMKETGDLGAVAESDLVKRGLVRDVSGNYAERRKTGKVK